MKHMVPREYSSGQGRRQGRITKTGNAHLRRILTEAAWSYRYKPALKGDLRRCQKGQSPRVQDIAWRAQDRLHRKYFRMVSRGKDHNVAITAGARELLGFIWAIACEAESYFRPSTSVS
ncbi:Transposase IS116/IS110/IS902 family protein [Alicyclobacillus hesperidum]|uniref:Transposase IS116/IS110/IS902 family protein n=1 Tax=Alicyclobacillus hesperidum TaxID=89784 RepID=A0A1H2TW30_9BACL|nr:Transposase IS116/IS110/IS902 family protein [Alicyclobacillus hesperidum]